MELIHGDLGDAILIRQPFIPSFRESRMAYNLFQRFLWHELGHYYAINYECPENVGLSSYTNSVANMTRAELEAGAVEMVKMFR